MPELSNEKLFWIALSQLREIGSALLTRAYQQFQSVEKLISAAPSELQLIGFKPEHIKAVRDLAKPDRLLQRTSPLREWLAREDQHIVFWFDDAYPQQLRHIHDPPFLLYAKGQLEALQLPQIAIVGARNATQAGLRNAERFASSLSQYGFGIASGLALGIDGAAHRGVIESNGAGVAVLGSGLEQIYPRRHTLLAKQLMETGVLLSELPLQATPLKHNFPRRNRIISGMSHGVLIVEAAIRSGSLITARLASEQGREVFAMPGSIHNPLARGCHQLIRNGAKLVESVEDIVEEIVPQLCFETEKAQPQQADLFAPPVLGEEEQLLYGHLGFEVLSIDALVDCTGWPADRVAAVVLMLELKGLVDSEMGGYMRAVPPNR